MPTSILIIGGGFGGISAARTLAKLSLPEVTVRIVDPKKHFEYHAALYRFITGRSPMEVCLPYRDIFSGLGIDAVQDTIISVDLRQKRARGASGSDYHFDILVLALGAETCYFDTPGLQQLSYGMKTAHEAATLRRHLRETFARIPHASDTEKAALARVVIVGGGASGVELAGELASSSPKSVKIELIEAMPRLLPQLSERLAAKVLQRLESLGVRVTLRQKVMREDDGNIYLEDSVLQTKTVVWTAGMTGCCLLKSIAGLPTDHKCRIEVDDYLRPVGHENVYVLGDAAATRFSGMAQTAMLDGAYVGWQIGARLRGLPFYRAPSKRPIYAVPVGPHWAAVTIGPWSVTGRLGWFLRRLLDLKVFLSFLSLRKAVAAMRAGTEHIDAV